MSSSSTEDGATRGPEAEKTAAGSVEVTMPETGATDGARVAQWLRRPGDRVEAAEALCLVEWDGNVAELASPDGGVLRMLAVEAGVAVPTGTVLARIETPPARVAAPEPEVAEPEPKEPQATEPVTHGLWRDAPVRPAPDPELHGFLSPAVRRFVAERDLDPREVTGTGRGGRVTLADVRAAAARVPAG